jgi:hypothetical protein
MCDTLKVWLTDSIRRWKWHQWVRAFAGALFLDAAKLHFFEYPPEVLTPLILACVATIFAPPIGQAKEQ